MIQGIECYQDNSHWKKVKNWSSYPYCIFKFLDVQGLRQFMKTSLGRLLRSFHYLIPVAYLLLRRKWGTLGHQCDLYNLYASLQMAHCLAVLVYWSRASEIRTQDSKRNKKFTCFTFQLWRSASSAQHFLWGWQLQELCRCDVTLSLYRKALQLWRA